MAGTNGSLPHGISGFLVGGSSSVKERDVSSPWTGLRNSGIEINSIRMTRQCGGLLVKVRSIPFSDFDLLAIAKYIGAQKYLNVKESGFLVLCLYTKIVDYHQPLKPFESLQITPERDERGFEIHMEGEP